MTNCLLVAPWSALFLGGVLAIAQAPAPPAAPPAAPAAVPQDAVAAGVHGRIEQHGGLVLLRVWGDARERGHAHGRLLGQAIAKVALTEFAARFARKQPLLQQARAAVGRLIEYPKHVQQELEGLWQGLLDSKVDLKMPELEREFDFLDLQVANALDVFGLMGCSSFTVWGAQAEGGGVLTARNFDWPLTGPHLLEHTIVLVQHLGSGRAVASVTWPGFVGTVTGISSDGKAAFLHTGSAQITYSPEPSSWPSATAARAILEDGAGAPEAVRKACLELLGYTSPPAGFLTHVVLPTAPPDGSPAMVFETDSEQCVAAAALAGPHVLTNHFRTRTDGRKATRDSLDRERDLRQGVGGCLEVGDRLVSVDEAWQILGSVQRGGNRPFGTLHALVFRHEPWCFQLRIGTHGPDGIVAAPASGKRYALTRQQLFADGEQLPR